MTVCKNLDKFSYYELGRLIGYFGDELTGLEKNKNFKKGRAKGEEEKLEFEPNRACPYCGRSK
jgi:hypothetical protein